MPENDRLTIVIADDHEVVRAGIRRILKTDESLHILDEASNGRDAVDLVLYHKPQVALLDIFMPQMTGIEATREIKKMNSTTFVVMLTAFEDFNHLDRALRAGADGYLAKDISSKELINSIHKVVTGERVFSKSIMNILQNKTITHNGFEDRDETVVITKREQEILNLVANGRKSSEIAEKLFISTRTVESHRYNIMQKLDIKNAAELIRYAVLNSELFMG